jgi:hypothetical protein
VANVKISALPAISSLTGTEAFPVVQSGTTSRITSANLRAYVATDTYVRNHANAAFDTANSSLAVNLTQNNSIASAFVHANAAFAAANNVFPQIQPSYDTANAAFVQANLGYDLANSIANNSTVAGTSNVANYVNLQTKSGSSLHYLVLANAVSGNIAVGGNTQLYYSPSTDTLSAQKATFGQSVTTTSLLAASTIITVFNTTATTIRIGGAATTINIGSVGGTTNVFGTLAVNGVSVIGFTRGAYDTGNSAFIQSNAAFNHANAAFASANNTDGVNVTQNNSITAAFAAANAATATNTTQNNSITASFAHANAAFTAANNTTSKTTGSWTVTTGTNTYSFTVPESNTYLLWVDCNIPNGILAWSATAVITNTNVPVVGAQYAWVYNGGGSPVDFTSIPNQFTGTSNTIVRSSVAPSATTNRFDFGINNSSGGNITVRYGWVKIS